MTKNLDQSESQDIRYLFKSYEKIPVRIWDDNVECSKHIARSIALAIRQKQQNGQNIVLGLATGSSPISLYRELVRMHREEDLSFSNVITFNLDEYYPMQPDAPQSYVRFMHEYLFDHIDIPSANIHIPDGTLEMDEIKSYCDAYEKKIKDAGGLDIQILGIGRTGHVGFNEPGSWKDSSTRLVRLDSLTMRDARKDFLREEDVPYRAITMGIETIMSAKTVYIMAWGQHKAKIVREAVEGEVTIQVPCTYLQSHPDVRFYVDKSAGEQLTRVKTPWLVGMCHWSDDLIAKAVIWLSQKINQPVLKLTDEDYNEHGLGELIVNYKSAYDINIKVFNRLQHTITGWPGGKPNADDSTRPERKSPGKKRVILFSPHPDDDVISMGGTFLRLVDQGHEVHVAYQTSGNIAVHDHDAYRFIEFYKEFGEAMSITSDKGTELLTKTFKGLNKKGLKSADIPEVRTIKGLIRRGEARAGARFCGLDDKHIHFLDLPFYETGKSRKKPIGKKDIQIVKSLIEEIKPHQVYAAGDLADPHGTHRVCLDAILAALHELKTESWIQDCWLWLYRGAWHEWDIDEIQMTVPLSPSELLKKRKAIFMHQSQKDQPPFPGDDSREFWERAEDRNRETAEAYRKLGLAEYEAMEAFRRWHF
ncbi:MAG: glucosamine-6-phosphate deaminase [Bacteroidota bacterium]